MRADFIMIQLVIIPPHMLEECFQFDSTKHYRFSPSIPVFFCSNIGRISDFPYWKSSLALIDLSSINKVSLV